MLGGRANFWAVEGRKMRLRFSPARDESTSRVQELGTLF